MYTIYLGICYGMRVEHWLLSQRLADLGGQLEAALHAALGQGVLLLECGHLVRETLGENAMLGILRSNYRLLDRS